jgi:hypothetical protein
VVDVGVGVEDPLDVVERPTELAEAVRDVGTATWEPGVDEGDTGATQERVGVDGQAGA